MLTAQAVIQTGHPDRYLARLCKHAGRMGGRLHQPHRHDGRGSHAPPEVLSTECSGSHATVILNCGKWTMHAAPGNLTLRAEAADAPSLLRIQDMLTTRLENFGRREHLTVIWQPVA